MSKHLNIAIDGPAGAGKSTAAKKIAEKLKIHYLDTGAMYRALGLYVLEKGVSPADEAAVSRILNEADIVVRYDDGGAQRVLIAGQDVTDRIRTPEVSMAASTVSAYPPVRDKLSSLQRAVGECYDVVMDGRDITTNVLPHTKHKFYVTASSAERARRRCLELQAKGMAADYEAVLADIEKRDLQDTTRDYKPLQIAPDAVIVDTTALSIEEVTDLMLLAIREKEA